MNRTVVQASLIDDVSNEQNSSRPPPNLPRLDLLTGSIEEYFKFCVPLYEASIKSDWIAAKAILDDRPELVRFSISENGNTALHVGAFTKNRRRTIEFVVNLVGLMKGEDLELENKNYNTALHLAAAAGNLEVVKILVEKNRALLTISDIGNMMPLNAAASAGNYHVVKYLFEKSSELGDDGWTNDNRGCLLEICVETNMFDVALQILNKYPQLGSGNVLGILARKPEAFCETRDNCVRALLQKRYGRFLARNLIAFVETLYGRTLAGKLAAFLKIPYDKNAWPAWPLLRVVWGNIAKMPKTEIDKVLRGPPDAKKPVSGKVDQALELQKLISEHIVNMHVESQNIIKQDAKPASGKEDQVLQLQKVISEHITSMQVQTQSIIRGPAIETYSSRVLFIAAEMGNINFVAELLRQYPDLLWKVNDNNRTIFHIAVINRHEGIYNILYEIGSMKDSITSLEDENGNNMLHLVAKISNKRRLERVSGVAFQMQRELLWFQEVKHMIPPSYRDRRNKDGLTPHELFTKEHEDLRATSEKWMRETANQCMVVAALIATIVFAAAFTVPGGYNQNNGIPIFSRDIFYIIFVVADTISLFSSSASTIMFISILTSRFAELDFLEALPKKLLAFLITLLLSITTMMIAFSVSFIILYRTYGPWIFFIITFCVLLVLLITKMQHLLFVDIIRSTYGSRYLFKPKKHVLYYENPKV